MSMAMNLLIRIYSSSEIDEQLLSYQDPWARDPGGRTGAIKAKKMIPRKYRAFNQNSTRSCAQLPNKSSLTLTRESECIKEVVADVFITYLLAN